MQDRDCCTHSIAQVSVRIQGKTFGISANGGRPVMDFRTRAARETRTRRSLENAAPPIDAISRELAHCVHSNIAPMASLCSHFLRPLPNCSLFIRSAHVLKLLATKSFNSVITLILL